MDNANTNKIKPLFTPPAILIEGNLNDLTNDTMSGSSNDGGFIPELS